MGDDPWLTEPYSNNKGNARAVAVSQEAAVPNVHTAPGREPVLEMHASTLARTRARLAAGKNTPLPPSTPVQGQAPVARGKSAAVRAARREEKYSRMYAPALAPAPTSTLAHAPVRPVRIVRFTPPQRAALEQGRIRTHTTTPTHTVKGDTRIVLYTCVDAERAVLDSMTEEEKKYASMLCVPLQLGGVDIGYSLVDQGASRAIIRRTKVKEIQHHLTTYTEVPVINHWVLTSSGTEIQVSAKFR